MDKEIYISVLKNEISKLLEENLLLNTVLIQEKQENERLKIELDSANKKETPQNEELNKNDEK